MTAIAANHVQRLVEALQNSTRQWDTAEAWGIELSRRLPAGARLLVAGNGGSAAQAQHLTAELVGRYRDNRQPLSAIALHAETSSLTAITNDYGPEEMFARQVRAHGRTGDVCLLMSTSGHSPNILAAARAAQATGLTVWAMTGPAPNPLATMAEESLCVGALDCATVQEAHLVALHLMCEALDAQLVPQPTLVVVAGAQS